MNDSLHHIRLLAGLEIESGPTGTRTLERNDAEDLASRLSADLARVVARAPETKLVVGGALFEPQELIRPGFPPWHGLEELAGNVVRQRGFQPGVMAIGAQAGRMPHPALQPPDHAPLGRFIAVPMLLVANDSLAEPIESQLEAELFERGSVAPPARATLQAACGLDSVHAQLLTATDLVALQQVQLDSAGLGGFWPALEHALFSADRAAELTLPGALKACWNPGRQRVELSFLGFDQGRLETAEYALWTRAFRTLGSLLDTHGVSWHPLAESPLTLDERAGAIVEPAGSTTAADGLTVHHHPDLGLVAWTVVEDGRMMHLYPLRPDSAACIERDLAARCPDRVHHSDIILTDPESGRLTSAS